MNSRIVFSLLSLVVILSVIGCFVPAQSEKLYGIVAQIITGTFAYLQAKADLKP